MGCLKLYDFEKLDFSSRENFIIHDFANETIIDFPPTEPEDDEAARDNQVTVEYFEFDANGALVSHTDAAGVVVSQSHSASGVTTTIHGGSGSPNQVIADTFHEGTGLLAERSMGTENAQIATQFGYNERGQLNRIGHNDFGFQFGYHGHGGLSHIEVAGNRLVEFDSTRDQDTVAWGNGQAVHHEFDEQGLLTQIRNNNATNNVIANIAYVGGHLPANNVSQVHITHPQTRVSYIHHQQWAHLAHVLHINHHNASGGIANSLHVHTLATNSVGMPQGSNYFFNGVVFNQQSLGFNRFGQVTNITNRTNTGRLRSRINNTYNGAQQLATRTTTFTEPSAP